MHEMHNCAYCAQCTICENAQVPLLGGWQTSKKLFACYTWLVRWRTRPWREPQQWLTHTHAQGRGAKATGWRNVWQMPTRNTTQRHNLCKSMDVTHSRRNMTRQNLVALSRKRLYVIPRTPRTYFENCNGRLDRVYNHTPVQTINVTQKIQHKHTPKNVPTSFFCKTSKEVLVL